MPLHTTTPLTKKTIYGLHAFTELPLLKTTTN